MYSSLEVKSTASLIFQVKPDSFTVQGAKIVKVVLCFLLRYWESILTSILKYCSSMFMTSSLRKNLRKKRWNFACSCDFFLAVQLKATFFLETTPVNFYWACHLSKITLNAKSKLLTFLFSLASQISVHKSVVENLLLLLYWMFIWLFESLANCTSFYSCIKDCMSFWG